MRSSGSSCSTQLTAQTSKLSSEKNKLDRMKSSMSDQRCSPPRAKKLTGSKQKKTKKSLNEELHEEAQRIPKYRALIQVV